MRIEIDFSKKLEENARVFFERAKKTKKKQAGLAPAIQKLQHQLEALEKQKTVLESKRELVKKRSRDWFEKFRWFFTTDGLLVIGGRDAKTNDWIVKKFLDDSDLFFHADIVGAPHCVLKTKKNQAPVNSLEQAAAFSVVFSRAWQSGAVLADAYWVLPNQVSKKAPSGESIGTGAFMVYGERHWFKKIPLECGIGLEKKESDFRVISGPWPTVQQHAVWAVKIIPGKKSKSDLAKELLRLFGSKSKTGLGSVSIDELIQMLPGEGQLVESK